MRDEHDRLLELAQNAQELVLEASTRDRIERAERLVHQHHRWIGGERACNADALLLTARELARIAVAIARRIHVDAREQFVDAPIDACAVPSEQARNGGDVVGDRHVRKQADLLDHVTDRAP